MTTGYTADVCNGKLTDFKQFAIRCAHAFGPLIDLREEGMDSVIPEFKPSPYYSSALLEAKAELAQVRSMTERECAQKADKEHQDGLDADKKYNEERLRIKERLLAMRSQAADWTPPTSEHQGLKDFMIQQLDSTIEFDCTPSTYYLDSHKRRSGAEWKREKVASLERNIEYYQKELDREIARVAGNNRWVAQLRASLA